MLTNQEVNIKVAASNEFKVGTVVTNNRINTNTVSVVRRWCGRFLPIIVFCIIILMSIAIPQKVNARVLVWIHYYFDGGFYMSAKVYDVTDCHPPLLCDERQYEVVIERVFPRIPSKAVIESEVDLNDKLHFNIALDGSLYMTSNADALVDVYELVSGKCIVNNLSVIKNNKTILDIEDNNLHYVIFLKMSDGTYYHQKFFINNNQLYKGGK